jgi:hypothetical protein
VKALKGYELFVYDFWDFRDCLTIIGGTALLDIYASIGLQSRATRDIDCVILVENKTATLIKKITSFVKKGRYKGDVSNNYCSYRFTKPLDNSYPSQIELFSGNKELGQEIHEQIKHFSLNNGSTSFSAIMLDCNYYDFVKERKRKHADVFYLDPLGMLVLKAKAYLGNKELFASGKIISKNEVTKHLRDVIRLVYSYPFDEEITLPVPLENDCREFLTISSQENCDYSQIVDGPFSKEEFQEAFKRILGIN